MDILQINQLTKIYPGTVPNRALSDIQLTIKKGEFVGVMGPSGSGKTTLLNMISTMDTPTSGEVLINGEDPYQMKKDALALFRRRTLGFVFQDFNLLDTLTIGENIILPLILDKKSVKEVDQKLAEVAKQLGVEEILNKMTYQVSGGQKQRAAMARAIIHSPNLLLADEPTGNLDSKASRQVMQLMESINQSAQTTMMLVTHDPVAASYTHRVIFIKDGQLVNEIWRGDHRQSFFQEIIDMLSFLGGDLYDFIN